jgi:hypothetical protein
MWTVKHRDGVCACRVDYDAVSALIQRTPATDRERLADGWRCGEWIVRKAGK